MILALTISIPGYFPLHESTNTYVSWLLFLVNFTQFLSQLQHMGDGRIKCIQNWILDEIVFHSDFQFGLTRMLDIFFYVFHVTL